MFKSEELKQLALAKRKQRERKVDESVVPIVFTLEQLKIWIKDLEGHVQTWAEDGHLQVEYQFKDEHLIEEMHAVATEFKTLHPELMVITHDGAKKITVSWSGDNHV